MLNPLPGAAFVILSVSLAGLDEGVLTGMKRDR
jgi:hypothetical protein